MPLTLSLQTNQESLGRNHPSIKDLKDQSIDSDFGPSSDEEIHEAEKLLASKKKNMKATNNKWQQRRAQEEEEKEEDDLDESASLDTMIFNFHETSKSKKSPRRQRQDSSNTSSPSSSSPSDSFSSSFLRTKATDKDKDKSSFNKIGFRWNKSVYKRHAYSSDDEMSQEEDEEELPKSLRYIKSKLRLDDDEDDTFLRSKRKVLKGEEDEKEDDDWLKPMPKLTKLPKPKPSLILLSTSSNDQKKKVDDESYAARPASAKKLGLSKTSTQPLLSRLQSPRVNTAMSRLKSPKVHAIKSTFGTLRPPSAGTSGTTKSLKAPSTTATTKISPLRLSIASSARISMKKSKNKRRGSSSDEEDQFDGDNQLETSIDDMIHKDLRQLDHIIRSSYQKTQQKERSSSRSPRKEQKEVRHRFPSSSTSSSLSPPPNSRKPSLRKSIEDMEKELRASTRFRRSRTSRWSSDEDKQEDNRKSLRRSLTLKTSPLNKLRTSTSSFRAPKMPLSPSSTRLGGTAGRRSSFGFKPHSSFLRRRHDIEEHEDAEDSFTEELLRMKEKKQQQQNQQQKDEPAKSFVAASGTLAEKIRKTAEEIDKQLLVALRPFDEAVKSKTDATNNKSSSSIMPFDLPQASRAIVEDLDAAFASLKQKAQDVDGGDKLPHSKKQKPEEISPEDQALALKRLERAVNECEIKPGVDTLHQPDQVIHLDMSNPFETLHEATRRKIQEIEARMIGGDNPTGSADIHRDFDEAQTIRPRSKLSPSRSIQQRHQRYSSLLHSPERKLVLSRSLKQYQKPLKKIHVQEEELSYHYRSHDEMHHLPLDMVVKEKIIDELDLTIMKLKHKLSFDSKEQALKESERKKEEENQKKIEEENKKVENKKKQDLLDAAMAKRRVMGISNLKELSLDGTEEELTNQQVSLSPPSSFEPHPKSKTHLKNLMKDLVGNTKPLSRPYERMSAKHTPLDASVDNLPDFFDDKNVMRRFEIMERLMQQKQEQWKDNQEEDQMYERRYGNKYPPHPHSRQDKHVSFLRQNHSDCLDRPHNNNHWSPQGRRHHDQHSPHHHHHQQQQQQPLYEDHDDTTSSTSSEEINQKNFPSPSSDSLKNFSDTLATLRCKRKERNQWFRSYEGEKKANTTSKISSRKQSLQFKTTRALSSSYNE